MKMQNFNSFGKKKCENLRNKWVNEEISGRCCLSFCLRLFDQWALLFVQSCNNVMQSKDAGVALLCGFVFSDLRLFNEWTQLYDAIGIFICLSWFSCFVALFVQNQYNNLMKSKDPQVTFD